MFQIRFTMFLMLALSILPGTMRAHDRDSGEYVILNAQYGNERNHVDVTDRLKELARRDRPFRISHESMATDMVHGHARMLRVFARGPNGQEQTFDFPDGSTFDGAMFRSWNRGDWGDAHWRGGWNGGDNGGNGGDEGQFLILSAQYGSKRRHVDVTHQLKQMARRDQLVRLDYRTFGVDPDDRHAKSLRIYARGPNGHERMFEYRDGSVIDGTLFRGWGRGEWGNDNDHWSGRWEVEEGERGAQR